MADPNDASVPPEWARELAEFANDLLKDQERIAAHANALAESVVRCEQAVSRVESALSQEASRWRSETAAHVRDLRAELGVAASRLAGLEEGLEAWRQGVSARVDAVEAGWDGLEASAQDLLSRIHADNERIIAPWREKSDAVERRLATLEAAWPLLSRSIPETVFRKVRQEMSRLEGKVADLTRRLERRGF